MAARFLIYKPGYYSILWSDSLCGIKLKLMFAIEHILQCGCLAFSRNQKEYISGIVEYILGQRHTIGRAVLIIRHDGERWRIHFNRVARKVAGAYFPRKVKPKNVRVL